jgi:hypothetical protein
MQQFFFSSGKVVYKYQVCVVQIREFLDLPDLDLLLFVQIRILHQQAIKFHSTSKLTFIIGD